ncbi:hypothetical protein D8674_040218 [Pyrus ussuriensis x Pyrus communis]|uniref:Uncharacterized protein n=1 Tax=Pyrus ussuriensis x Pyrus communis TaxID=2448454 RepID=A0A5N5I8S8_9ROSA|nr:hypothetical protein D8674_040218 [Pyrus ussuriensis x Pyrus communis]
MSGFSPSPNLTLILKLEALGTLNIGDLQVFTGIRCKLIDGTHGIFYAKFPLPCLFRGWLVEISTNFSTMGKRSGGIKERFDRFLATDSWNDAYTNFKVRHLESYNSDHVPILLTTKCSPVTLRFISHSFQFEEY